MALCLRSQGQKIYFALGGDKLLKSPPILALSDPKKKGHAGTKIDHNLGGMTIELKNRVSPSIPPTREARNTAAPRVEEPSFATSRQLKLPEGSQREVTVGDVSGTIYYKAPTAKQVAVVYADDRIRTALIASCLIAEGKDSDQANQLAASALGACYHGGNKELEKLGIEAPAIILPTTTRDGGIIAHELAHALGGSEREANEAQRGYLKRRGVTEIPMIDPTRYATPELRPSEEGKVISLAVGPVGGGGGGWHNYNRLPAVKRVGPPTGVNRVEGVKRPDLVELGSDRASDPARQSRQQRSEESPINLAVELAGAALAAAAATASEIAARAARLVAKPTPPPEEKKVAGVSGGMGAGMNPGQHGGGQSQGDQRRGNAQKQVEKKES